jgi:putative MFS transporter
VLEALHLSGGWASYGSVAITLLFVVGCVIATRLVNTLGRRKLLLHSFLWSGLALLLLGFLRDGPSAVILLMFGLYALFIGGAQVLQLVYPNEIFLTEIRAGAVGWEPRCHALVRPSGPGWCPFLCKALGLDPQCTRCRDHFLWPAGVMVPGARNRRAEPGRCLLAG